MKKGFSLIELLVMIAIISMMMAVLIPMMKKAKEGGKITKIIYNCENISQERINNFIDICVAKRVADGRGSVSYAKEKCTEAMRETMCTKEEKIVSSNDGSNIK